MTDIVDSKKVKVHFKISQPDLMRLGTGLEMEVIHNKVFIGSAYNKSGAILRGLSKSEEKQYLPSVLGLSPKENGWEKATRDYWANIRKAVPPAQKNEKGKLVGGGLELEVGFYYESEEEAEKGRAEAKAQLVKYKNWEQASQGKLHSSIRRFKEDFTVRQTVGTPINVEDYIIYRYCLAYSAVALSPKFLNMSPKIRFYIEDSRAEMETQKAAMKLRVEANKEFALMLADEQKVKAIIRVFNRELEQMRINDSKSYPVQTFDEQIMALERISIVYPSSFVKTAKDPNLKLKATVETCILKGVLNRLANTETIMFGDNVTLGHSLQKAIIFLNDEKNIAIRNQIVAQLKTSK